MGALKRLQDESIELILRNEQESHRLPLQGQSNEQWNSGDRAFNFYYLDKLS